MARNPRELIVEAILVGYRQQYRFGPGEKAIGATGMFDELFTSAQADGQLPPTVDVGHLSFVAQTLVNEGTRHWAAGATATARSATSSRPTSHCYWPVRAHRHLRRERNDASTIAGRSLSRRHRRRRRRRGRRPTVRGGWLPVDQGHGVHRSRGHRGWPDGHSVQAGLLAGGAAPRTGAGGAGFDLGERPRNAVHHLGYWADDGRPPARNSNRPVTPSRRAPGEMPHRCSRTTLTRSASGSNSSAGTISATGPPSFRPWRADDGHPSRAPRRGGPLVRDWRAGRRTRRPTSGCHRACPTRTRSAPTPAG